VADPAQVTDALRDFCRVVYVPVEKYDGRGNGVVLPPVIWDSQRDAVLAMLKRAAARGAQHALAGNPAHLALIREAGLIPHGDFRLNVLNRESVRRVARMGWEDVLLGPEMTLPQLRDVCCDESLPIPCGVLVYGRIPLMVLEKCVGKELADCAACEAGTVRLRDRRGMEFPVLRAYPHRSVIYNSLPTDLCDRQEQLARNGIRSLHLLFSVETPREVDDTVRRWQTGSAPVGTVRRLPQELN
jgi:putative protease